MFNKPFTYNNHIKIITKIFLFLSLFFWSFLIQAQPLQGLIAYFPLNGNVADYTGNGHDGMLYGNSIFSADRHGHSGMALYFNGVSDFIKITNATGFNFYDKDFTFSLWINEDQRSNGLQSALISKRSYDKTGYALSITGDEHPWGSGKCIYQLTGGANSYIITTDTTASQNWYHLVFTYNNLKQIGEIYINGKLNYASKKLAPPLNNNKSLYIGADSLAFSFAKGYLFKGRMDDIRFYNRKLSSAEIDQLYKDESCLNSKITQKKIICEGDSIFLQNEYRKTPGVYYDSLRTVYGCDIKVITELAIDSSFFHTIIKGICSGDSILIGNKYRKAPGIYYDSLVKKISGCDSIIKTELTVGASFFNSITKEICEGDSILIGKQYRKTEGIYYDSHVTITGCDSIIETKLVIHPSYIIEQNITIPKGDSIFLYKQFISKPGLYKFLLHSKFGCDSLIRILLNVDSITKYHSISGKIITRNNEIVNGYIDLYQTQNLKKHLIRSQQIIDNSFLILGVPEDNYILLAKPDSSSGYVSTFYWKTKILENAYKIYVDGDIGNVNIHLIAIDEGIEDDFIASENIIFPNPANDVLKIKTDGIPEQIDIISIEGIRLISSNSKEINIDQLSSGIYFIQIIMDGKLFITKFIKL